MIVRSIRGWSQRPGYVILAGRVVNQAGFFLAIVLPAIAMSEVAAREVLIPLTVCSATIASVLVAVHAGIVREGSEAPEFRHAHAVNLALGVPLVLGSVVVCWALARFTAEGLVIGGVYAVGLLALTVSMLGASLYAAEGRVLRSAVTEILVGLALGGGAVVLLALDSESPRDWAIGFTAGTVACAIASGRWRRDDIPRPLGRLALSWRVFVSSRTLIVGGIVMSAFNRADYVLMSQLASATESTRYALATRLAGPLLVALGALNNSLFVQQTHVRRDPAEVAAITHRFLGRMMRIATLVSALGLLLVVAGDQLIEAVGDKRLVAPVALLLGATLVFAATVPWGYAMNATGNERRWTMALLVAVMFDLALVWIVSQWGAVAVAACWLATQAVLAVAVSRARTASGFSARPGRGERRGTVDGPEGSPTAG